MLRQMVSCHPPDDRAHSLPFGLIADVDRQVFLVGGDEDVGGRQALKTCDFEAEVAVREYGKLLIQQTAIRDGCIHGDYRVGRDHRHHRIAGEIHTQHALRMRAPTQRSHEHILHLRLR